MKPTERLRNETDSITNMLNVLEAMCERLDRGEQVDSKDLKKVVIFLKSFVDICHNKKEEMLLIPELESAGALENKEMIQSYLKENTLGKSYILELGAALKRYRNGVTASLEEVKKLSRKYIDFERNHIAIEEEKIFPKSEKMLSEETKNELNSEFDKLEDHFFGENQHGTFQKAMNQIVNKLKTVYLATD